MTAVPLQADYLIKTGVKAIFVGGTTGESLIMSMAERKELAKKWVEVGKEKGIKVIIHVGAESIREAKEFSAYCEQIGVDGIGAMSTVFFKPNSVQNLVAQMKEIASGAPNTPFLYYHLPSMTGCTIGMPAFLKLALTEIPTFAGIKFTDVILNDVTEMQSMLKDLGKSDEITLLYGVDESFDVSVFMRMDGGVGSTYNYAGQVYNNIMEAYKAGDHKSVRKYQYRSELFVRVFAKYNVNNMYAHKLLASWTTGVDLGPPRLPYIMVTDELQKQFRADLEKIGYFDWVNEKYSKDKSTNSWIIGGIITGALVLIIIVIGLYYLFRMLVTKNVMKEEPTAESSNAPLLNAQ